MQKQMWATAIGSLGLVLAGLGLIGFTSGSASTPATFGERLREPVQVAPSVRVPGLADLWSESSVDPPVAGITFYSRNRPLVTLCVGAEAACRQTWGMRGVLRSEQVGGRHVTIGVVNPGVASGLGPRLLHYWQTVPLVEVGSTPPRAPSWPRRSRC